jgi:hypothetical protein
VIPARLQNIKLRLCAAQEPCPWKCSNFMAEVHGHGLLWDGKTRANYDHMANKAMQRVKRFSAHGTACDKASANSVVESIEGKRQYVLMS